MTFEFKIILFYLIESLKFKVVGASIKPIGHSGQKQKNKNWNFIIFSETTFTRQFFFKRCSTGPWRNWFIFEIFKFKSSQFDKQELRYYKTFYDPSKKYTLVGGGVGVEGTK